MATKKPVARKIPKTLGACADALHDAKEERLALEKQVEALRKFEAELTEHIIRHLPKSDARGIAGKKVRVTIRKKTVPTVRDWDKLHAYILKNAKKGAFALLQKRVSATAIQEVWDAGKEVPGVEPFEAVTLSVNKL